MKKNMLKYCLMLLTAFLFCVKAMSATVAPVCGAGGASGPAISLEGPGDPPPGYSGPLYILAFAGSPMQCFAPAGPAADDLCVFGNCTGPFYEKPPVPLGNGAFILMLFVLGYGCFLYYRHRQEHKAA